MPANQLNEIEPAPPASDRCRIQSKIQNPKSRITFRVLRLLALVAFAISPAVYAHAESMPVCRVLSGPKGGPGLVINGDVVSPLFFCANNQFGRDDVLLDELKLAADAGLPLFAFNVPLAWDGDTNIESVLDTFCPAHPTGYFYVRVWIGGSGAWLAAHPDEAIRRPDGTALSWVSPASAVWRADASRLLADCLRRIQESPYANRFVGVHITSQMCGEWFYPDTNEFIDYSNANAVAFRAWLKGKYINDKGLRRAWGDEHASLSGATIPMPEQRDAAAWGPFRDALKHRPAMDYQQYSNELIADCIADFAGVAKKAMKGRGLVGAFYGYTMEVGGIAPRSLAHSGHLALTKLLDCRDIDLIHAPYSYLDRQLGNPAHMHLPLDSVALHGKLVVIEEDSRTHTAKPVPEEALATGNVSLSTNADELLSVNRRNIANALTHRAGMWYFDVLADGRWIDKEFWTTAPLTRRLFAEARTPVLFQPQIAFVADEDSIHTMRATTYPYLMESLSFWRRELDRLGTPVGYYLQSDLPRLPDSIHVLILANAYSISTEERRAIDKFLSKGGTVVWTFAPDVSGENGVDVARIRAATGFNVSARDAAGPIHVQSEVTQETWTLEGNWNLKFEISNRDDMHVIARFKDSNAIAVAATPLKGGVSVYAAVPRLPVGVLRWIGANTFVHFCRDTPGMVGLFGPYFVVHTSDARRHTFALPDKVRAVERLVPFQSIPCATDTNTWQDDLPANTTAIYRITR
ncbi:MAG: hypothetical protein HUU46_06395 [Candidatus Hydrogenedentes bacterium]|nr:hypothetical protein [Candidatus Hydrogenedentota bacterium]